VGDRRGQWVVMRCDGRAEMMRRSLCEGNCLLEVLIKRFRVESCQKSIFSNEVA